MRLGRELVEQRVDRRRRPGQDLRGEVVEAHELRYGVARHELREEGRVRRVEDAEAQAPEEGEEEDEAPARRPAQHDGRRDGHGRHVGDGRDERPPRAEAVHEPHGERRRGDGEDDGQPDDGDRVRALHLEVVVHEDDGERPEARHAAVHERVAQEEPARRGRPLLDGLPGAEDLAHGHGREGRARGQGLGGLGVREREGRALLPDGRVDGEEHDADGELAQGRRVHVPEPQPVRQRHDDAERAHLGPERGDVRHRVDPVALVLVLRAVDDGEPRQVAQHGDLVADVGRDGHDLQAGHELPRPPRDHGLEQRRHR
mmetsp:Transcript_27223/g.92671  ORF Transcript_27223/g.92671 Transcript_27223/m.92671 type:complete len:315 (+) Transcript_27223:258-1202(+)